LDASRAAVAFEAVSAGGFDAVAVCGCPFAGDPSEVCIPGSGGPAVWLRLPHQPTKSPAPTIAAKIPMATNTFDSFCMISWFWIFVLQLCPGINLFASLSRFTC
jgi:hypothetical protein